MAGKIESVETPAKPYLRALVSEYWTPEHLDVTDVPITYARPKPNWLEGFLLRRKRFRLNAEDRACRRRLRTNAIVSDPGDLAMSPSIEHLEVLESKPADKLETIWEESTLASWAVELQSAAHDLLHGS